MPIKGLISTLLLFYLPDCWALTSYQIFCFGDGQIEILHNVRKNNGSTSRLTSPAIQQHQLAFTVLQIGRGPTLTTHWVVTSSLVVPPNYANNINIVIILYIFHIKEAPRSGWSSLHTAQGPKFKIPLPSSFVWDPYMLSFIEISPAVSEP